jgi:tripartite-type tricarboxylate transporter receptor subunit TctC
MMRLFIFVAVLFPLISFGQGYPSKPVRMIIPFAPGGASDFVGRILQPRLGELLGQQVIAENRPGASGNIGVEAAAKSPPDGYAFLLGNIGSIAINPGVFAKLAVNPLTDLIAVTQVVDVPSALVAHPTLPVSTLKELVEYAKLYPGKLNYASPGSGSQNRLEMEVLRNLAGGLEMVHVPYKGGAGPAIAGLVGGETHLMFVTVSSAIGHVRNGRLKMLAISTAKRMEQLPSVPTTSESGYPELAASSWQGVFVPAGTPRDLVERLHAVVLKTMASPEVVERLANGGVIVTTSPSPAAFSDFVAKETQRWVRVAKEANATAD